MEPFPQSNLKSFPRKVEFISPAGSLSPVDSGSLSPAKHARPPDFIQKVTPHQGITGLSSANCHGKIVPDEVFLFSSGVHQFPPTEINNGIPSGVIIDLSKVPLLPHIVIPRRAIYSPSLFPNGVVFSYRYSCNHHPQRKPSSIPQQQPRI